MKLVLTRRRFIFSVALPTLLAVAVLVVWARSYRYMDEWSMATDEGELRAMLVYQGAFHYVTNGYRSATRPISYDWHDVPPGATWGDIYGNAGVRWNRAGFRKLEWQGQAQPVSPVMPGMRNPRLVPWVFGSPYKAWTVPFWPLVVLCAAPLARLVAIHRIKRRRVRRNRCPMCAYDLRATPGRCPECGWARAPA
jgi:hypothetical protein